MTLIGAVLLAVGVVGALGSIVFAAVVGQWAMAAAAVFVAVAVVGALLVKPQR